MQDPNLQSIFFTNCKLTLEENTIKPWYSLYGVENISLSHSFSYSDQFILGGIEGPSNINAPIQTNLTIDKYIYNNDNYISFYESNNDLVPSCFYICNAYNYHVLTNSYLTNYSVSFSVGDLPKMSMKFSSYEYTVENTNKLPNNKYLPYGMIPNNTITKHPTKEYYLSNNNKELANKLMTGIEEFNDVELPKLDSIFISGIDKSKITSCQNIYSMEYSITYNMQALFSVGDAFPMVKKVPPQKVNVSISSKLQKENYDFIGVIQNNLSFSIIVSGVGSTILQYPISGAKLISQELNLSSCDILDLKRNYVGYIL